VSGLQRLVPPEDRGHAASDQTSSSREDQAVGGADPGHEVGQSGGLDLEHRALPVLAPTDGAGVDGAGVGPDTQHERGESQSLLGPGAEVPVPRGQVGTHRVDQLGHRDGSDVFEASCADVQRRPRRCPCPPHAVW